MPANEQTWRDQKFLHVVFGLTSIIMLLSTIWMMAKDHNREWKVYQRQFRNVEAYAAGGRLNEQESADYYARERELKHKVEVAQSEIPPIEAFLGEAQKKQDDSRYAYRVDRIEEAKRDLGETVRVARAAATNKEQDKVGEDGIPEQERKNVIKKRDALVAEMQDVLARAKQ